MVYSQIKYLLAHASGIPYFTKWSNRNRLLVLAYHGIYDGPRKIGLLPDTFIHADDLYKQLQWIKQNYYVITPDELRISLENNSHLPSQSALITFDDGYESFYRLALPILNSLNIQALIFISTRYIEQNSPFWFDIVWYFTQYFPFNKLIWLINALDLKYDNIHPPTDSAVVIKKMKKMLPEQRDEIVLTISELMKAESAINNATCRLFYPMTEEQIKAVSSSGNVIGGHSHTHTILSVLPSFIAENEVLINKKYLDTLLNVPCVFFAYPNGGKSDYDAIHKILLKKAGYKAAFSLTQRRSLIYEDPMDISRINVVPEDTLPSLALRCTGIRPVIDTLLNKSMIDINTA